MAAVPAARHPSAEPARIAAAQVAQEPRAEPAEGALGDPHPAQARDKGVQNWDAIPNPLGGKTLRVVLEVYGWLNWATLGYMRNRPFRALLLQRDERYGELPPRGLGGPGGPRKGPPGHDSGRMAQPRAGVPGLPGGGSGAPMSPCPSPCAAPLSTGATARGTRRHRSPRHHKRGGAGDGWTHER